MGAYLFTAATTRSQMRLTPVEGHKTADRIHTWDACHSLIVCANNSDEAQKRFEEWLCTQPEEDNPMQIQIRRIVAAQFVDQLLTETEYAQINWPLIAQQEESFTATTPLDDFEQGYWVDVNKVVPVPGLSSSIETLREGLPEEIRSSLNWLAAKQFLFLLSVLSPPPPPAELKNEMAAEVSDAAESPDVTEPEQEDMDFPELVDKDAAVLIQARNSVVAAWLWRRFAANTPLAVNAIRIDPWCGVMGAEDASEK